MLCDWVVWFERIVVERICTTASNLFIGVQLSGPISDTT